jgi:transcriptional regulator with XRE-family HTH domain
MTIYTPLQEVLAEELQNNPELREEWDRTELARAVSQWLVAYRARHGLTQTQLAELLDWKQSVVARLESGEREPALATLQHLMERLGGTATIAIRPNGLQVRFGRTARRSISGVSLSSGRTGRRGSIRRSSHLQRTTPVLA